MHIHKPTIPQTSTYVLTQLQKEGIIDSKGHVNLSHPKLKKLSRGVLNQVVKLSVKEIFGGMETPEKTQQIKNAPDNGHHPIFSGEYVYPELGQILTLADIGKEFVRIYPYLVNNKCYDWSYIPDCDEHEIRKIRLIDITAQKIIYSSKPPTMLHTFNISWNDGYWTPVEKFLEHIKKNPKPKILPDTSVSDSDISNEELSSAFKGLQKAFETVFFDSWIHSTAEAIKEAGKNDYSYKKSESAHPPQSSEDPRKVLGLPPECNDFTAIKKAYRKLAAVHHPDKRGNPEDFMKIDMAFKKLENELQGTFFVLDEPMNAEAALFQARIFTRQVLEKEKMPLKKDYESIINAWRSLHDALCKVQLEGQVSLINDDILDMRTLSKEKIKLWEFQIPFRNLDFTIITYLTHEEQIDRIKRQLTKLKELNEHYDLENTQKKWTDSIDCLWDANVVFLDKYVALSRSLAELYIFSKQWNKALEIRTDIVNNVPLRLAKIRFAYLAGTDAKNKRKREEFTNEPSKSSRHQTNFKQDLPKMNNCAPIEEANKKSTKPEVEEIQAMHENLLSNLAFFKLPLE